MSGRRVVVTGMAGITSLGSDWTSIEANFSANRSGIRRMHEWDRFTELNTRLAGPVDDFSVPSHWTRKQLRSMGRVSRLSVLAAERALVDAGLWKTPRSATAAWVSPAVRPPAAPRRSRRSATCC